VRHITDYIALSSMTGVAKLRAPTHLVGRTIGELCAPYPNRLQVLLVERGLTVITHPGPGERVQPGDELLVVGADEDIDAFADPGSPDR
jgi:Trk K+ transport system NAD-binding subunit